MAFNTESCIFVIAEGQEQPVKLSKTLHDSRLSKSLISRSKALATRGSIQSSPPITLTDHTGTSHTSTSTISLRWYHEDGTQSFPETFYIVENIPTKNDANLKNAGEECLWDAILCSTSEPPSAALAPQVNTLMKPPPGSDPRREKERKERREMDQEKYAKEREAQTKKIRDALASKHLGAKHG